MKYFKLKCIICNNKEEKTIDECKGSDNPICNKCMGPMIVEKIINKEV